MATQVHCAYCFESLVASLEKRPALSLAQTEVMWRKSNAGMEDEPVEAAGALLKPAAVSRILASPSSSSSSSSLPSASSTPSGASSSETNSSITSQNSSTTNLDDKATRQEQDSDYDEEEEEEHPLFVTWNTISPGSHERRLRGCIGTFEPLSLSTGLSSYALTSAFDDTRFPPITKQELPSLECAVTLLTHFEPVDDPMDWEVGVHGLRISFTDKGRRYGSTYLPDVAREQGWSKEETIVSLMRKAGWGGRKSEWRAVKIKVVRYQGKKVSLAWDEWKAWRDEVDEQMKYAH
ncbi:hypothetical protein COCSADRAFT_33564 [Bipolaris sorokiniana ND90Pr]|uniref:AMMECR1 domain-containing protein n=1 Tax=Cochliobolus sativus (strain ND90Pr / ATCC 201652) TaxID=665912 RepID=M2THH0_COCSN|nr:uncharacterized protein COCSADRAFT_33564 [Bipolaris sorokiniana ND90Pr]EMD68686.1 hypothetical protein COCSADRAFT_33564 [Bipolaris sorokiniana ND90Pr]